MAATLPSSSSTSSSLALAALLSNAASSTPLSSSPFVLSPAIASNSSHGTDGPLFSSAFAATSATLPSSSSSSGWLSDAQSLTYLDELTGYSVEQLQREPLHLAQQRKDLVAQTQSLAVKNYKAFIQTAECSRTVAKDFSSIESHLGTLESTLPQFSAACEAFLSGTKEISARRREIAVALEQHSALIDILELPQLMDTCVRNGYYDEALEVDAYVQRFARRHRDIRLVADIAEKVRGSRELLLSQLLGQLRGTLQLPACLRIIGYLRRLGCFGESELRSKFLESRDCFIQSSLPEVKVPQNDLNRYIDACRVHLFDIITQYRAIFTDDWQQQQLQQQQQQVQQQGQQPHAPALLHGQNPCFVPLATQDSLSQQQLSMFFQQQAQRQGLQQSRLLYGWVVEKISAFLAVLETHLPALTDGASLGSILGQCMYFGMSLGRVGIDFRTLLVPLFENRALALFASLVEQSTAKFMEAISTATGSSAGLFSSGSASGLQQVGFASGATAGAAAGTTAGGGAGSSLAPPAALMDYPTIAILTNGYLIALNELKHCAPLSIAGDVQRVLQASVTRARQAVQALTEDGGLGVDEKERQNKAVFLEVVVSQLVPYVSRCLQAVYPGLAPLTVAGVGVVQEVAGRGEGGKE